MSQSKFILEMNQITKEFPGVKALDNVTFKVKPGTVHALMGENGAGKSTLMKCLFGIYKPDNGDIIIDGQPQMIRNSKNAINNGISMIHQELHPILNRSVKENIWLGRFPVKKFVFLKFVDDKKMYKETKTIFDELDMDIDPNTIVRNLSVSKIQSMEIAKATSQNAKIIIMDEPTSSLTETEVNQLFKIIRELKSRGVAIIYISHKIEEILKISDEVTIMRDGKYMGTWNSSELTTNMIISKMVGRDLTDRFPPIKNTPGNVVLKVNSLTSTHPKSFKNITFELRKGEILGIGGLVGAQRTELVEAIFGIRSISAGQIYINGKQVNVKSPVCAKLHKMALLTEERRVTGIFPVLSVMENTLIANMRKYKKAYQLLDEKKRKSDATKSIKKFKVKTPTYKTLIKDLSGGNQQKVLLARWILTEPEILILDEPTRGIDVGAKYEIYTIIAELASQGKSIIMISSEMPELIGMSHRIMVMCEGRLSGMVDRENATEKEIMTLATQFS